jgi:hypothetical protein
MTLKNKFTRAIKTSPNIRSQIFSKNRQYKFSFLLSLSYGSISLSRVHHRVQVRKFGATADPAARQKTDKAGVLIEVATAPRKGAANV